MPLAMNREAFITCAITGAGSTQNRSRFVPRAPAEIAESAIKAAKAGAANRPIATLGDPESGAPVQKTGSLSGSLRIRIRDSEVDVVLNLTAGMGGDLVVGDAESPLPFQQKWNGV